MEQIFTLIDQKIKENKQELDEHKLINIISVFYTNQLGILKDDSFEVNIMINKQFTTNLNQISSIMINENKKQKENKGLD